MSKHKTKKKPTAVGRGLIGGRLSVGLITYQYR